MNPDQLAALAEIVVTLPRTYTQFERARAVVEVASDPSHILHGQFDWEGGKDEAARRWLEWQALPYVPTERSKAISEVFRQIEEGRQ